MWDFFKAVVQGLPGWFVMLLTTAVFTVGIYFLPRMRRDKQGRLYIHSNIYEQKKHDKKLDRLLEQAQAMEMSVLKLRILNKNNLPQDAEDAYRLYKQRGGNGYIDHFYKKYWEPRLADQVAKAVGEETRG
jgi:hypothetical protein